MGQLAGFLRSTDETFIKDEIKKNLEHDKNCSVEMMVHPIDVSRCARQERMI